jgi:hypothetical protein
MPAKKNGNAGFGKTKRRMTAIALFIPCVPCASICGRVRNRALHLWEAIKEASTALEALRAWTRSMLYACPCRTQ